ncbi:hypothetical protein FSP39_010133 [Pinctada imbricata]|uniref:Uncharacterized protein n=1 Tax=Pinctada imbricata TaxID=66713 RepID=A0AA88YLZ8_PINIB|nr:hypothetical protein FSP39_010133 [Pinctada imbricata]
MDDDIIKQAAMRRQRRAKRDPGDSVPTESFSQPPESKCSVDFGNKTFSCGEDDQVTVKLVNDRDLPLRYRHNNNLAASV